MLAYIIEMHYDITSILEVGYGLVCAICEDFIQDNRHSSSAGLWWCRSWNPNYFLEMTSVDVIDESSCKVILDRLSKNRQEEENTITFHLKCIVIA